jgi:hypothetical protein
LDTITAKNDTVCEEIRLEWQAIARAEVLRYRRRLGPLTPEQESAVESVLVCVANQLFEQLSLESVPLPVRLKCLKTWRRDAVAA